MVIFINGSIFKPLCLIDTNPPLVIASPLALFQVQGAWRSQEIPSSLPFVEFLAMTESGCMYVMINNDVNYLTTPLIMNLTSLKWK